MAGLDSIKKYAAGSTVQAAPLSSTDTSSEAQGTIPYQPAKSTGIAEKVALDPTQTQDILANMQKYIDEREGFVPSLARGLTRGMATGYGPSSLAAVDREQALEDKQIMEYRQTMAAYKAAQAQAQRDAEEYAQKMKPGATAPGAATTTGGGGGMTYGGISVPESVQAQLTSNATANKAILDKWLQTRTTEFTKAEANPASLARQPVVVWNPIKKEPEVRDVNMYEYWDLKQKGLIKQPSEYYESNKPAAAPSAAAPSTPATSTAAPTTSGAPAAAPSAPAAATTTTDIIPRLQKAVYSTESSSGAADTTKPGIQGAVGPMQVTSGAFETAKRLKLIPSTYDINNPEQNKDTGFRLLAYYQNKYQDPDKALAAYFGGEGAINADGSINLDRKDALGTSIAQYIAMNKAKAGLTSDLNAPKEGVQVAGLGTSGFPDVASIIAQKKIAEEEATSAAKERGKSGEEKRTAFETDIAPTTIIEDKETNKRIQDLVKNNPGITGVLAGPGYAKAVAGQLERGIGNISVNELSTAIAQTLPDASFKSLSERNELATYLARMELKAAKMIKGQGQITEGEREILKHASSSIKDPAEAIYKKAKMLERIADLNDELSKIYGDGSKFPNFRTFNTDPRVVAIHQRYQKDLNNILSEPVNFARPATGAAPSAPAAPKEGDEKPSKSGKPMIFRNGQWVYK
jgi:soluble lytic murein transglycosylase-like protein